MLQKRVDLGSIPYGLAVAGEDLVKGSAVVVKVESGVLKAYCPTTQAEADSVKGFVTYRMEHEEGADKDYETLKAGSRVVIYTLVKNNMWGTTQFSGTLSVGDALVVGYGSGDKGKLRVKTTTPTTGEVTTGRTTQFTLFAKSDAGYGYTDAMIDVEVV